MEVMTVIELRIDFDERLWKLAYQVVLVGIFSYRSRERRECAFMSYRR
jgi:hypothetical protein